jgi:hypothetical protein
MTGTQGKSSQNRPLARLLGASKESIPRSAREAARGEASTQNQNGAVGEASALERPPQQAEWPQAEQGGSDETGF